MQNRQLKAGPSFKLDREGLGKYWGAHKKKMEGHIIN